MSDPNDLLRVETTADGLALHGELTYCSAGLLSAHLDGLIDAARPRLVLDVSGIGFCDSLGLSTLIGAQHRARRHGGGVTLRGVQGPLRRLLDLTGVDMLFASVPTPATEPAGGHGEPA
ncbi:MAG TPA: STAS domain-containing protein [Pseudonocardia sp.]|nr:STAS domain-containing protein [Pseudonocardia sp.]